MNWCCALLLVAAASVAHGQYNSYPHWDGPPEDPRERRALRDRAVAHVGRDARPLVESDWGDEAALVLLRVSPQCAAKLVECHASGALAKVSRPREVLLAVLRPRHGDDVCNYITDHADELTDADCCDAFLKDPLTFALGLKKLQTAGAERRAKRLAPKNDIVPSIPVTNSALENIALVAGGVLVVGVIVWIRRRRLLHDGPA